MTKVRVRYHVAVSLDGFIAPLDGSVDWLAASSGGGDYERFISAIGGIVMGRQGFETELSFGPWSYSHLPVLVMTNRPIEPRPEGVEIAGGDPRGPLNALANRVRRGDIWLFGGGTVAGCFLDAGLIDQVELTVLPVVLGAGRSLFAGARRPSTLSLVETRIEGSAISSVYVPADAARD